MAVGQGIGRSAFETDAILSKLPPRNIPSTPETFRRLAASATLIPTRWSSGRTGGKNKLTEHGKTRPFVNQPKQGFNLMLWREELCFADGLKMAMWWVPWDRRAVAFQHTPGTPSGTSSPGHERPQPLQRSPGSGTWSETWAALGGAVGMERIGRKVRGRESWLLVPIGVFCSPCTACWRRAAGVTLSVWQSWPQHETLALTHSHSHTHRHKLFLNQQTVALKKYCQKYYFLIWPTTAYWNCLGTSLFFSRESIIVHLHL